MSAAVPLQSAGQAKGNRMIKRYCDCCGQEMLSHLIPKEGMNGGRLQTTIERPLKGVKLTVEVIHSKDGCSNAGDVCKHCILDALQVLDDRPTERAAQINKTSAAPL